MQSSVPFSEHIFNRGDQYFPVIAKKTHKNERLTTPLRISSIGFSAINRAGWLNFLDFTSISRARLKMRACVPGKP